MAGQVGLTGAKLWGFEETMRQHEYELICIRSPFFFANILAQFNRTEMVLYSICAQGSQFSGEENNLKIGYLVAEILSKRHIGTIISF